MQMKLKTILLLILGLGTLLLVGGAVSAGPDTGNTPYAGGCAYESGGCGGGGCGGYDTGLSQSQIEDLQREKEAFYNATGDLRKSIVEKQRALSGELAKQKPDAGRAGDLQNELNDLKGKFNQQYLQSVIAMKKIVPGYGTAPGSRQSPDGGAGGGALPSCCTQP